MRKPECSGLSFPSFEEGKTDALSTIGGQQYAFAEVQEIPRITTAREKWRLHLIRLCRHRCCGCRANDDVIIESKHENGSFRAGIGRKIGLLISRVPVIEIGKFQKTVMRNRARSSKKGVASLPEKDLTMGAIDYVLFLIGAL